MTFFEQFSLPRQTSVKSIEFHDAFGRSRRLHNVGVGQQAIALLQRRRLSRTGRLQNAPHVGALGVASTRDVAIATLQQRVQNVFALFCTSVHRAELLFSDHSIKQQDFFLSS